SCGWGSRIASGSVCTLSSQTRRDEFFCCARRTGIGDGGCPGGSVEPGETITDTIARECREEIGVDVALGPLTGWYFHSAVEAQVGIFRCDVPSDVEIVLSDEHDEFRWEAPEDLRGVQEVRVTAALSYRGELHALAF
ncbi:MAG TPA: NUDIX hydrolase, partial [Acidimicrobiales bacterium]|nr:NUDIX hydrolase [Acidimicrobiales bacterium]